MSDNKLVKTVTDAAVLTGLVAAIGWIAKKVVKENFTADPSSNAMNYVKFTAALAGSIAVGLAGLYYKREELKVRAKTFFGEKKNA